MTAESALRVFHSILDVPQATWDVAAGGEASFHRGFLAATQTDTMGNAVYIVHEVCGDATLVATGLETRVPGAVNLFGDMIFGRLSMRFPALTQVFNPMLLLRARMSHDGCIVPSLDAGPCSYQRLSQFWSDIEDYVDSRGLSLAILDVPRSNGALRRTLEQRGYRKSIGRPVARLHIEWDSWEGYLHYARLHSQNSASAIRKEVNRARKHGLEISEWQPERVSDVELFRIYDHHHRRKNGRGLDYPEGFLSRLKQDMGGAARVLVAHQYGRLVGSALMLVGDVRGSLPLVGIDHSQDKGASAYFNLMYYQPIRVACEAGLRTLSFGNAAYAAKIRRGCRAECTYVYWRPKNRLWRVAASALLGAHRFHYERKFRPELNARAFSLLTEPVRKSA
jgi:hypothetical protein